MQRIQVKPHMDGSEDKTSSATADAVDKQEAVPEFRVTLSSINPVQACENADELSELGVNVFRQSDLERGIFQQAEKHIEAEEARLHLRRLERELLSAKNDRSLQKDELKSISTRLNKLNAVASSHSAFFINGERKRLEERHRLVSKRLEHANKRLAEAEDELKGLSKIAAQQSSTLERDDQQEADNTQDHASPIPAPVYGGGEEAGSDDEPAFLGPAPSGPSRSIKKLTVDECVATHQATSKKRVFRITKQRWSKLDTLAGPSSVDNTKSADALQNKSKKFVSPRTKPSSIDEDDILPRERAAKRVAASTLLSRRRSNSEGNDDDAASLFDAEINDEDKDYNSSDKDDRSDDEEEEGEYVSGDEPEALASTSARRSKRKLSAAVEEKSSGKKRLRKKQQTTKKEERRQAKIEKALVKVVDDADDKAFINRVRRYKAERALELHERMEAGFDEDLEPQDGSIMASTSGSASELKCPGALWEKLFRYQQIGVKWLWELHTHRVGGILGDEMGLGKTIQIIAYFAALHHSRLRDPEDHFTGLGPSIIVAPATVLHQWVSEFQKWYPLIRVGVLHATGTAQGTPQQLIRKFAALDSAVLVTTYQSVLTHSKILQQYKWHVVVLDEGHKIRNVDTKVTVACKYFRTPHRLILSGSPIQNSLKELWSLFDFIFPGKLGTLPIFLEQFAVPITQGGYANATQMQVRTAHKCAVILRDTISPYLLRRTKADLNDRLKLPGKEEQVLFCRLTPEQRDIYKRYLQSDQMQAVTSGRCQIFVGLCALRKICNHPELFFSTFETKSQNDIEKLKDLGDNSRNTAEVHERSGKLMVVHSLLKLWHKQGHKVLLFSQTVQMLNIIEHYCRLHGYTMLRMDGTTPISQRQTLVKRFNADAKIFVFLLTTRVGGIGVNLVGANRVVIYDPDWNPSTDMQARERAWRIGQKRDVVIYRLLTTGTVEEKIYHRQIFKQFLTDKVLKDARHTRFFKHNDLHELFTLAPDEEDCKITETEALMAGAGAQVNLKAAAANAKAVSLASKAAAKQHKTATAAANREGIKKKKNTERSRFREVSTSDLKDLARELSKKFSLAKEKADAAAATSSTTSASSTLAKEADDIDLTIPKHFFHGKRIDYLDRQERYAESESEDLKAELARERRRQNDYVLGKLFEKSLVHGALKHDAVVGSGAPDETLVEEEAERVAQQAVKALKESRRQCHAASTGRVNWPPKSPAAPIGRSHLGRTAIDIAHQAPQEVDTPTSAVAVSSSNSGGAASSSTSLLLRMQQRNWQPPPVAVAPADENGNVSPDENDDDDEESEAVVVDGEQQRYRVRPLDPNDPNYVLLMKLRDFIKHRCLGDATTDRIVDAFHGQVPQGEAAIFRTLLRKICRFEKRPNNVGVWTLRSQFY